MTAAPPVAQLVPESVTLTRGASASLARLSTSLPPLRAVQC